MPIIPYTCPHCGQESVPVLWEITNVEERPDAIVVYFKASIGLGDPPRALHVQLERGYNVHDQEGSRRVEKAWTEDEILAEVEAVIERLQERAAAPAEASQFGALVGRQKA